MNNKKQSKPTKKDQAWFKKVEINIEKEEVKLDHPKGKERFKKLVKLVAGKQRKPK